jgi:glycerol-3-phosphate dehydrogenase subunit B
MSHALRYDVVVIGCGTAGLVAATRLAQRGARVCVLAKGYGSTHLAPGTIDTPTGIDAGPAIRWFRGTVAAGPLPDYTYVGELAVGQLRLPTAAGALKHSMLVPSTQAAGTTASATTKLAIVGTPWLRDFQTGLCAANLRLAGLPARAVEFDWRLDRADATAVQIAHRFDEPAWRERFCDALLRLLAADEGLVGLPAVLGLRDPAAAHADLERRLERRVFEIPTLPPSVPGMRLFEVLRSTLRQAGARFVLGAEVTGAVRDAGDRITGVSTASAGHDTVYAASSFVLASGGTASGAIEVDSRRSPRERVLGLPLDGLAVAVDSQQRSIAEPNVVVAGASLPIDPSSPVGCSESVAIATGYRAGEALA